MNCSVIWDPSFSLSVVWKKDNADIIFTDRIRIDKENNGLVIKMLQFSDAGKGDGTVAPELTPPIQRGKWQRKPAKLDFSLLKLLPIKWGANSEPPCA